MSSFRTSWLPGERRDARTRAVLVVTLAALVFGLALQSARACASGWNAGSASADSRAADARAGHCHHDADAPFDACFVHCEQDGQSARAGPDAGTDDLRLAAINSIGVYGPSRAPLAAREPAHRARRPDLPAYLLLHRLNR